jgi:uncharacterized protein
MELERRFVPLDSVQLRAVDGGEAGKMVIEGHPILYGMLTTLYSDDEYELREIIMHGAAAEAMGAGEEVLLWNHDSSQPMARRSNGTLEASEDARGVFMRADVSKTVWGRNGYEAIRSSVVDAMSFGFYLSADGYSWAREKRDGKTVDTRTINKFSRIIDYSPVTYPAYKDTDVQARSKDLALKTRPEMSDRGPDGGEERAAESEVTRREIQKTLDEMGERMKTWRS